ncbi:hypothetical protein DRJ17_03850 [Candidatus Woesearchaeota archaeon]|nr:MAG: hypothetical protein DRJ17_03850 [Candidatus Woesearchaeota archaeon]
MENALRILASTEGDKRFFVSDGQIVSNLYELPIAIRNMSLETFSYHVNANKNDFSNWINDVLGDSKLASDIAGILERDNIISILEGRLNELNHIILAENLVQKNEKPEVEPIEPIVKKIEKKKLTDESAIVKVEKKIDNKNVKKTIKVTVAKAGDLRKTKTGIKIKKRSAECKAKPKANKPKVGKKAKKTGVPVKGEVKEIKKKKKVNEGVEQAIQIYSIVRRQSIIGSLAENMKKDMKSVFNKENIGQFWSDIKFVFSYFKLRR